MAGTFSYLYDPQQPVWVIDSLDTDVPDNPVLAIRAGEVIRVRSEALLTGNTLYYDVRLSGEIGTVSFVDTDVFGSLIDATDEYELRLTPV